MCLKDEIMLELRPFSLLVAEVRDDFHGRGLRRVFVANFSTVRICFLGSDVDRGRFTRISGPDEVSTTSDLTTAA